MAVMGDIEMILYALSLLIKQFTLDGKSFPHPADQSAPLDYLTIDPEKALVQATLIPWVIQFRSLPELVAPAS